MEKLIEGVVIESTGETAKVRCSIHSDCESCGVCPGNNAIIIDVTDQVGAQIGQQVLIESKETNMLLAAFMIFVLPFLAVGLGIFLGYYLSLRLMISAKLLMILGGLIFGFLAIFVIRRLDKSLQSEKPTIVKTIK
ncbi:MAG TPA: SoxR reducing system RseC family protein [Syntrophomonadaceae bacterium]|nr:SoxR reducing system RseC family protein [Syntrophomonadaceae bacterium]